MKSERVSDKKIRIEISIHAPIDELWDLISQPYKMTLWFADRVRKTSRGFDATIKLPLYEINLQATIMQQRKHELIEFRWNSEYVMDTSIISIFLEEVDDHVKITVEEIGNFDQSRWTDPQSIHLDLWEQALTRLATRF